MRAQPDDPDRRAMAQELALVLFGVSDLEEVRSELLSGGLDITQRQLPNGGTRFIITELCNGEVWDHFTFSAMEYRSGKKPNEGPND